VDYCELLKIPYYIVFNAFHVTSNIYHPPFLRVYILEDDKYVKKEIRTIALKEGEESNLDLKHVISMGNKNPFNLGIIERKRLHNDGRLLYRLVLIDSKTNEILLTRAEIAEIRAEKAETLVKKEKERAENAETQLKKYQKQFGNINEF
jgi:hypothetical protein